MSVIDDVGRQFKDGEMELQQVVMIFEKLSQSPILPAGVSLFVKRVYIRDSGLDDDEKEAAHLAIQRFSRGVIDESIPETERESVLDMISTKDPNGNRQFKQKLTDTELRAFVAAVTKAADDAGVPDEVPEINFADEFDKAIDEALNEFSDEQIEPALPEAVEGSATTGIEAVSGSAGDEKSAGDPLEMPATEQP